MRIQERDAYDVSAPRADLRDPLAPDGLDGIAPGRAVLVDLLQANDDVGDPVHVDGHRAGVVHIQRDPQRVPLAPDRALHL